MRNSLLSGQATTNEVKMPHSSGEASRTGLPQSSGRWVAADARAAHRSGSWIGAPFPDATRYAAPEALVWLLHRVRQRPEFDRDSADWEAYLLIPRRKWRRRSSPLLVRAMLAFPPVSAGLASDGWQTIFCHRLLRRSFAKVQAHPCAPSVLSCAFARICEFLPTRCWCPSIGRLSNISKPLIPNWVHGRVSIN